VSWDGQLTGRADQEQRIFSDFEHRESG
jgi:hypothetical protein